MVEAALIVPIVIIAVIVVLYIMLLIFQICMMQSTANSIAERAAANYFNQGANFTSGKTSKLNISNLGLYRRWDFNSTYEQDDFMNEALIKLQKNSILKGHNSIDIQLDGSIINQKITVVLDSSYNNPIGSLMSIWGLDKNINLRVYSEATIDDPVEFIRNSDFILETASKVPVIREFEAKWQEIVNKIVDYINKHAKGQGTANG